MVSRFLIALCALFAWSWSVGAPDPIVSWSASLIPGDARPGESAQIVVTGKIKDGWHIYAMKQTGGPIATEITLPDTSVLKPNGEAIQPPPIEADDPNFGIRVGYHKGATAFALPVQLGAKIEGAQKVIVNVRWQACNDTSCAIPETTPVTFTFTPGSGPARPDRTSPITAVPEQPEGHVAGQAAPSAGQDGKQAAQLESGEGDVSKQVEKARSEGLLAFLRLAVTLGLLSLLTPCVFPMIPITVSYFAKPVSTEGGSNLRGAFAFSIGIISTFTIIGFAVTLLFGASGTQDLATNPILNLVIAILFVVFALNLFGVFEIRMPSFLLNRAQSGTRRGGFAGPLFMGVTAAITSMTCTVPFVGTILALATKEFFYPLMGMIGFSLAFATPFFLLALFPQSLAKLPKSGSWMSSVKVFMGFIEIAAAVKFASNADLVWHLGMLTRPVFVAIWAIVALVAALYLMGWITLPTAPNGPKIGIGRRVLGLAMAGVGGYCLASLNGAPLGEFSAFLPPDPYPGRAATGDQAVKWVYNFDAAKQQAASAGRPIFVNFTGYTCTNCRWMEQNMFPRPAVKNALDNFIAVELFTDGGTPTDESNRKLRDQMTGVLTLPVYVIVAQDGRVVKWFEGSTRNEEAFLEFLRSGLESARMVASR